jgi:methyltransferase (TIGR00027 family)
VNEGRPSLTASLVASVRALYTVLPEPYRLASDPLAEGLVPKVLAVPVHLAARVPWAAPALHRGLGFATLGLVHHVELRTRAIDDALREAVALGATELVLLGAGLDARAMRLVELEGVTVYEVDHPSTQRYKVERLAALPTTPEPTASRVERVPLDFEQGRLDQALLAAGFQPARRSFWIWEGVTVYLAPEAVAGTLRAIASLCAPGSRVAVTYGGTPEENLPAWLIAAAARVLGALGEPMKTPLESGAMAAMLADAGFAVVSDDSTVDWAARYWPWEKHVRPIERLAVAQRLPSAA